MNLVRVGAARGEIVPLPVVKQHLRVDGDDEDGYLDSLIRGAVAHLDGPRGVLGRCIQQQAWALDLPDGWSDSIRLPLPTVEDVSAVTIDGDGAEAPLPIIQRACGVWTFARPVESTPLPARVSFVAGVPDDILPALRQAVLLIVGNWYLNREEVAAAASATALPLSAQRILAPLKIRWV